MKSRQFLYLGFIIPILFWTTTFACSLMIENYNHLSGMVSELGALGTKPQFLFTAGLVLCSILNIFFVFGLIAVCKKYALHALPVMVLFLFSFLAGPALCPMPLRLHGIVGIPFPFIMLSPFLALVLWRKNVNLSTFRLLAVLSLLIMLLGFLIFSPGILAEYFGLKQRFLYIGWSIWSVSLSYRFLRLTTSEP